MKSIFLYIKLYKWPASIAFVLMLVELCVELIQPLIIGKIIDDGILKSDMQTVIVWGSIMLGLGLFAFLAGITNGFFSAHAAQSFAYDLRNALFQKVQSLSTHSFQKFQTSALITRLTNDVTQVQQAFFMSMRFMLRAPLVVLGSFIMIFIVDATLAKYLIIGIPFLFIFLGVMIYFGTKNFAKVQKSVDRLNQIVQENLQAMRLVKAYMRGAFEILRFDKIANQLKKDTVHAVRMMELILPVLLFVMNGALLLVLWMGAKQMQANEAEVGNIVSIVNYAMRITGNFTMFAFIIMFFTRAKASADRIEEVFVVKDDERILLGTEVTQQEAYIAFEKVSFRYPASDKQILKEISFNVNKGETVAIMGATGSGKTTLLQLIPKLYAQSTGTIFIDYKNTHLWAEENIRQKIGYVPQKSLLFTGTIFENISWGKSDATHEEVIIACEKAQIHEAIMRFPEGYESRVGQKGVNLSGGQKQRIAIARALIRKPEILLFDDSMSALDIQTERKLWEALQNEQATILIVTQKVHTAMAADRILLLKDGEIEAFGAHEQLLMQVPLYKEIVASQTEVENYV